MPYVTFIHGIANKPAKERLLTIWRQSLARDDGINLGSKGVGSSMVYWADVLYAEPATEDAAHESSGEEVATVEDDEDLEWAKSLQGKERDFFASLARKLDFDAESPQGDDYESPEEEIDISFERVPLPWFVKRRLMKAWLRDVHHYLFNSQHSPRPGEQYRVQDEIRQRFVTALKQDAAKNASGPHVVVSHSMGTVVAYDCLQRVPNCPKIDALVTIGSPLGIDEVQDKLKPGWSQENGFPAGKVRGSWVNFYDRLDPVALDARLKNDYCQDGKEIVSDERVQNSGKWRHDITKYFSRSELRSALATQLGI